MSAERLATARRRLDEGVDVLDQLDEAGSNEEFLALLPLCEAVFRRLERAMVNAVATLDRKGVFAERGYRSAVGALSDLVGWERVEARRRVLAAEHVCRRTGLDGTVLPPRLERTAEAFAAGRTSLRHVEVIARVLRTAAAERLAPEVWAGAEAELAAKAEVYTPSELQTWGTCLIDALDQDGAEPDEREPEPVDELRLVRLPGGGGKIAGRFEDAALFDGISAAIDAKAAPLTADDHRSAAQRQADALAEVCGYVLDHGDLPQVGGRRPHLNVFVRLEDLENRCRPAMLDFGGRLTPGTLRTLACDAAVIPVVLGGRSQPLDVGRLTRSMPDGLRRAVVARGRGCEYPGCGRPPSWCEAHHVIPWQDGGETALHNLVLLCRVHHRLIHRSGWVVRLTDGLPEFVPPTAIDPQQRPRAAPRPQPAA